MALPTSYMFPVLNLVTLVLVYSKVEGDLFFFSWTATLAPTLLSFLSIAVKNFSTLIYFDPESYIDDGGSSGKNGVKIRFIKCLFNIVFSIFAIIATYMLALIKDKSTTMINNSHLFALLGIILVTHIMYSHWVSSEVTRMMLPLDARTEPTASGSKLGAFFSAISAPIVNFLGASMVICGGGSCTTIYGSTISAILGAFGVSATEWLPFLDWLTGILVVVSVYVVYRAKRDIKYKPFMLSFAAGVLIIINMIFLTSRYLIYIGNAMMLGAAFWNYKLNVPKLFKKSKKSVV